MYIYIFFLLRMTDTMTFLNTDLSSWDTLYMQHVHLKMATYKSNEPSLKLG
jgi:hypothetical protein